MNISSEKFSTTDKPSTPIKEKIQRGKRMWESRLKTKNLENQLKFLENRIKHLQIEQDKCIKTNKFIEKRNNDINVIREKHEKFKQAKIEWELAMDQEDEYKRHSFKKSRKQQADNIQDARKKVENRNRVNSLCVKAQSKANDAFMRKVKENNEKTLRLQAKSVMESEKSYKNRFNQSSQRFFYEKESQYSEKYYKELEKQDLIKKKIEELAKVEEDISVKFSSQDQKHFHSTCLLFSDKSCSLEKDINIPSIV
ncbi:hypothetical protein SteCoe_3430 [Stentor coeruleus]|uniref:Uncharacterized protein n=1 Tax=Stentor coeruleus TaxID=5963 RepID=A0A1R2CX68_9CILI|nr:hypothetical protein SteCoe_3430 [Stentor coeruleus]